MQLLIVTLRIVVISVKIGDSQKYIYLYLLFEGREMENYLMKSEKMKEKYIVLK